MASASLPVKSSARVLDTLALFVSLAAPDSELSRRGMIALLQLRRRQLDTMRQSRGAFVKLEPSLQAPFLDLGAIGAASPLSADYHSLLVLQLIAGFPERGEDLRALLAARRAGLDLSSLAAALWREDGADLLDAAAEQHRIDADLLAGTLWVALKPLYEAVAAAYARHIDLPAGGLDCPVCGGPAWAMCNDKLRCAVCETAWQAAPASRNFMAAQGVQARGVTRLYDATTGERMTELEPALFAHAFDPGPIIELLQLLDNPAASVSD